MNVKNLVILCVGILSTAQAGNPIIPVQTTTTKGNVTFVQNVPDSEMRRPEIRVYTAFVFGSIVPGSLRFAISTQPEQ
jgi:hypothetical protein